MKIIDADALKADLRQYFTDGVLDGISARLAFNQILHDIDNASTVFDDNAYSQGYKQGTCDSKYDRPQGEWIKHIRCIECSVCKHEFFTDDENENCQDYEPCTDFNFNFCPKCGADMRGEQND